MTLSYKMATRADTHALNEFRWQVAMNMYSFGRKSKRSFKKDFLFFLNDELHENEYQCYYAFNDDGIQATIYWEKYEEQTSYENLGPKVWGYIRYFDKKPMVDEKVCEILLEYMIAYAKKHQYHALMIFGRHTRPHVLVKQGFVLDGDTYVLHLS